MTALTDILSEDVAQVIADIPENLTWTPAGESEQTIPVAVSAQENNSELRGDIAGILDSVELRVLAQVSSFTNSVYPASGEIVTLRGSDFQVDRPSLSPCRTAVVLYLKDKAS